jgi:protein TonB
MLAYAANRPVVVDRKPHPNAMLFIIGAHVAVAAVVMSAKMDLPGRILPDPPTKTFWVPKPKDPPPPVDSHQTHPQPKDSMNQSTLTALPLTDANRPVDTGKEKIDPTVIGTGGASVIPEVRLPPMHVPVSAGVQLLTPPSELKPPYPPSKLLNEEEAALRLRLTIDEHGRVIAVDPVGRADAVFLAAARRHLLAHWRYKPAVEDGQAVASSMVITLRFELDG